MKHAIVILLLAGLATTHINAATAKQPNDIPSGPYQQTCNNISVVQSGEVVFSATCYDSKGTPWRTQLISRFTIDNSGWDNVNGNLFQPEHLPGGPWTKTCSGSVYDLMATPYPELTATCLASDGSQHKTSVFLYAANQAENDNGVLKCVKGDCGFSK